MTTSKPEFSWEKEKKEEKDAYELQEKGTTPSLIKRLLKKNSLRDIMILSEVLKNDYTHHDSSKITE